MHVHGEQRLTHRYLPSPARTCTERSDGIESAAPPPPVRRHTCRKSTPNIRVDNLWQLIMRKAGCREIIL